MGERDLAELFLVGFMQSLIGLNAPLQTQVNGSKINTGENAIMQESVLKPEQEIVQKPKTIETKAHEVKPAQTKPLPPLPPLPSPAKKPIKIYKSERPILNYSSIQSSISVTDKLNSIIRDPHVSEIECLGAESPLIVKKGGSTQKTQVNLSIDEVYELIAEFSQKTRIPVINGKIKAALNDLVITAVLSESLGPRFIIQKKKQFQELI